MTIEQIRHAQKLADRLEKIRSQIEELRKTSNIDSIRFKNHQSGAPQYSYEVNITGNKEVLRVLKDLTENHLIRERDSLKKKIDSL